MQNIATCRNQAILIRILEHSTIPHHCHVSRKVCHRLAMSEYLSQGPNPRGGVMNGALASFSSSFPEEKVIEVIGTFSWLLNFSLTYHSSGEG
jgi:hypothetical protein